MNRVAVHVLWVACAGLHAFGGRAQEAPAIGFEIRPMWEGDDVYGASKEGVNRIMPEADSEHTYSIGVIGPEGVAPPSDWDERVRALAKSARFYLTPESINRYDVQLAQEILRRAGISLPVSVRIEPGMTPRVWCVLLVTPTVRECTKEHEWAVPVVTFDDAAVAEWLHERDRGFGIVLVSRVVAIAKAKTLGDRMQRELSDSWRAGASDDWERALRHANSLLHLDPLAVHGHLARGRALSHQGRFAEAEASLKRASAILEAGQDRRLQARSGGAGPSSGLRNRIAAELCGVWIARDGHAPAGVSCGAAGATVAR